MKWNILILLSTSVLAQNYYNPEEMAAAKAEIFYLFDQSGVSKDADDDAYVSEYYRRQLSLFTPDPNMFWQYLPYVVTSTLIGGLGIFLKPHAMKRIDSIAEGFKSGASVGIALALGNTMTQGFSYGTSILFHYVNVMNTKIALFGYAVRNYYIGASNLTGLEAARVSYIKRKRYLSLQFQEQIENKLAVAILPGSDDKTKKEVSEYVENVLKLPFHTKPVNADLDKLEKALGFYPSRTKESLMRVLTMQMTSSEKKEGCHMRFPFYFVGPPGTGKTRAAELIAKILQIPIVHINLDQIKQEELFGTTSQPGIIARALMEHHQTNILVFLDEVHHSLNHGKSFQDQRYESLLKRLLDPSKPSYKDVYFNVEIPLDSVSFVLAATEVLEDRALRNRVLEVEFMQFPKWYKKHVLWSEMVPSEFSRYNLTEDLTNTSIAQLNQIVDDDKEEGFRWLQQRVYEYVADDYLKKRMGHGQAANDDMPFEGALTAPKR